MTHNEKKNNFLAFVCIIILVTLAYFLFIYNKNENACIYGCLASFESKVAIQEAYSSDYHDTRKNLYVVDIPSHEKTLINPNPSHILSVGFDKESKNRIAYIDDRKSSDTQTEWTLFLHTLDTGEELEIIDVKASDLNLYRNKIFFIRSFSGYDVKDDPAYSNINRWDEWQLIYYYDLDTGETKQLTDTLLERGCLSVIDEENIIYIENSSLYLENYQQGNKMLIKNGEELLKYSGMVSCPAVYQNQVVYSIYDRQRQSIVIYLFDIITKETNEITEVDEPLTLLGVRGMSLTGLWMNEDEIKILKRVNIWDGPDSDHTVYYCTSLNTDSGEKKDISCRGGLGYSQLY